MNERETKELLELTRDNNRLLHKMRRHAIFGNITRLIYWVIIFGLPIAFYYYYIQPYAGQIFDAYSEIKTGVENVKELGDQAKGISGILDDLMRGIGR